MLGRIPSKFLDTKISVYRKTNTQDNVGDTVQTTSLIYNEIQANLQPDDSQITYDLQGVTHIQTHFGFINTYDENDTKYEILPSDEILDTETGLRYLILGIEHYTTGLSRIEKGGYTELALKHIADSRYETVTRKTISTKARIDERDTFIKTKPVTTKGLIQ